MEQVKAYYLGLVLVYVIPKTGVDFLSINESRRFPYVIMVK